MGVALVSLPLSARFPSIAAGAVGLVGEQQAADVTLGPLLPWGVRSKTYPPTGRRCLIVEAIPAPSPRAIGAWALLREAALAPGCFVAPFHGCGHQQFQAWNDLFRPDPLARKGSGGA